MTMAEHEQGALSTLQAADRPMSRAEWVARELRQMIRQVLQPGDRLPAVRQLATTLGVSAPTVRAGQALLQHDGVVELRHGSGVYVTAAAARPCYGIVSELNLLHPSTSIYFRVAADTARRRLAAQGAETRLYLGQYANGESGPVASCPPFWEDAEGGRLDGGVLLNLPAGAEWPARVARCRLPMVGAYTGFHVDPQPQEVTVAACRELRAQGASRCAFIGWCCPAATAGFVEAATGLGLEVRDEWVKTDLDPAFPGSGWAAFRELWAASPTKPDGIIIVDDVLFTDAQLAVLELGIAVPDQLKIVVQTNVGAGTPFRLPVVAFEVDPGDAGVALADLLLSRVAGASPRAHTLPASRREIVAAPFSRASVPGGIR
jgi:DNA-binding LacI/PurR family transcriptional regulator